MDGKRSLTGVQVPKEDQVAVRWCTGESISGPSVQYIPVGGNYKTAIYIEGHYCKQLVGILRLIGYDNNDIASGEDNNLEVVCRPMANKDFAEVFAEVAGALAGRVEEALRVAPAASMPMEYRELKDRQQISNNGNVARKHRAGNTDSRGSRVGKDSASTQGEGICGGAHRVPVLHGEHADHLNSDKAHCFSLHMVFSEEKNTYELCTKGCCARHRETYGVGPSLFSQVVATAGEPLAADAPVCSSCQAIKENLAIPV